jgi:hypothetical protein
MLAVLCIMAPMNLSILVDVNVLLKLLQGVLRAVSKSMQTSMHVIGWDAIAHHARRGQGIVGRETMKWVGEHFEGFAEINCVAQKDPKDFAKS